MTVSKGISQRLSSPALFYVKATWEGEAPKGQCVRLHTGVNTPRRLLELGAAHLSTESTYTRPNHLLKVEGKLVVLLLTGPTMKAFAWTDSWLGDSCHQIHSEDAEMQCLYFNIHLTLYVL